MIILKKNVEFVYRITFLIVAGISLLLHFDINDEYYNTHEFSFFTVQSNIFCFVMMILILIKYFRHKSTCSKALMFFKGMALSAIICTFLVYHFAEACNKYDFDKICLFGIPPKDLFAHYLTPFMYVFDWIIFQPKGYFKWWHIPGWLSFPALYFMGFMTRCQCNDASAFCNVDKYPYFFLDYETLGVKSFLCYILVLLVIFTSTNTLIVMADKYMYKHGRKNRDV